MSNLFNTLFGGFGGVDIGVLLASIGYLVRKGIEFKDWWDARKEQRLTCIIADAIQWVYVNRVQPIKKANGELTYQEGKEALDAAVAKTEELARQKGVKLDLFTLPGRVQSTFAQIKAALENSGTSRQQEVIN